MRLLNAQTLEFELFLGDPKPKYVILSHTWGNEEVTYQEMCWLKKLRSFPTELKANSLFPLIVDASSGGAQLPLTEEEITRRAGYEKIVQTAKIAKTEKCSYFWVDTCCIDKTSSTELQEAVNSMYRWYQESYICAVHLEDAEPKEDSGQTEEAYLSGVLLKSRWITRGWTLQELIAPRSLFFHDKQWRPIANKLHVLSEIEFATRIPVQVLETGRFSASSIAQRMSWAADRSTTRVEDRAYSLLGLFDVQMPMLYGEGEKAFIRLQEEILKHSTDDSIFAWKAKEGGSTTYRGLLARSPSEFQESHDVLAGDVGGKDIAMTGLGLQTSKDLCLYDIDNGIYKMILGAYRQSRLLIYLKKLSDGMPNQYQYARVNPRSLLNSTYMNPKMTIRSSTIQVRQHLHIPEGFRNDKFHSFRLRRSHIRTRFSLDIGTVSPSSQWRAKTKELIIPETTGDFESNIRFRLSSLPRGLETGDHLEVDVLLGFRKSRSKYWCRILKDREPLSSSYGLFNKFKANTGSTKTFAYQIIEHPKGTTSERFGVSIQPGLQNDKLCLFVDIDGLSEL
ncbi:heterokaryon incompatibility protein-domain-containing protein [Lophiotrema nucula]|uniref:Heterokaryon incompatibility protein-domain-containing protein n=1 Tax=Lophiotrema nucula TaxID=690887 RepID=A0A6A5YQM0_9PLEO|nr:heterokaryon incompatibility protein-domain-containing protein [Lophiotrema nucula]